MSRIRALFLALTVALVAPACGGGRAAGPTVAAIKAPTDPIAKAPLEAYLSQRFAAEIAAKTMELSYGSDDTAEQLFAELKAMGIDRVDQLAAIIPADYQTKAAMTFTLDDPNNIPGLLRDLMMVHDAPRYFRDAWKEHWYASGEGDFKAAIAYGLDYASLEQYGVVSGEGGGGEEGGWGYGGGDPCGGDENPCGGGDENPCGEGNPCGE